MPSRKATGGIGGVYSRVFRRLPRLHLHRPQPMDNGIYWLNLLAPRDYPVDRFQGINMRIQGEGKESALKKLALHPATQAALSQSTKTSNCFT